MADALTRLEQARNPEPPVLSQWQRYELDESAWTVLAAQLYRRTMTWRQVPLQLSAEELESFGPQPPEPDYPKEPTRNSEAWLQWSLEVSRIQHAWEHQVSQWQEARQESSASWDLSPVPEWEPVSTIPPHIRPWVPVERWENAVQRAQSTVPRVETKWTSRWDPKNRRFVQIEERTSKQATVTTEQTIRRSLGARYVSLPETLVIICPTVDVPEMHRAAESGVLILTRVGFAAKDGAIQAEPVPGVRASALDTCAGHPSRRLCGRPAAPAAPALPGRTSTTVMGRAGRDPWGWSGSAHPPRAQRIKSGYELRSPVCSAAMVVPGRVELLHQRSLRAQHGRPVLATSPRPTEGPRAAGHRRGGLDLAAIHAGVMLAAAWIGKRRAAEIEAMEALRIKREMERRIQPPVSAPVIQATKPAQEKPAPPPKKTHRMGR